jgi:hypothetical protein
MKIWRAKNIFLGGKRERKEKKLKKKRKRIRLGHTPNL